MALFLGKRFCFAKNDCKLVRQIKQILLMLLKLGFICAVVKITHVVPHWSSMDNNRL